MVPMGWSSSSDASGRFGVTLSADEQADWEAVQAHLGVGRDLLDVGAYPLGQAGIASVNVVDQFQAIDLHILLLAQPDAGAPVVPAIGALADAIQLGTDKSDGDRALVFHDWTKI